MLSLYCIEIYGRFCLLSCCNRFFDVVKPPQAQFLATHLHFCSPLFAPIIKVNATVTRRIGTESVFVEVVQAFVAVAEIAPSVIEFVSIYMVSYKVVGSIVYDAVHPNDCGCGLSCLSADMLMSGGIAACTHMPLELV
jgi:hypothetical protein